MFSSVLRPGIALGTYPQRESIHDGWFERLGDQCSWLLTRPSRSRRFKLEHIVSKVARYGEELAQLNHDQVQSQLEELRYQLSREGMQEPLVARSFALVRELADRYLGMRHHDVQLMGGWIMLHGMLAEMETGEGKTLTATLSACTAALSGIPVHIITFNDYLVKRDAENMRPLYEAMGLSVGTITEDMDSNARRAAYACDITYCTGKQVAFDYLRDRIQMGGNGEMHLQVERLHETYPRLDRVMLRGLCFAIVDEADSLLIDEARTPLIISRNNDNDDQAQVYQQALQLTEKFEAGHDFVIRTRARDLFLTETGKQKLDTLVQNMSGVWQGKRRREFLARQALTARHLYQRDKHYLVKNDKVQIIDEFTGRVMGDRSWEHGLHQLIECKEGCAITGARETLASVSYQRFFRRYLWLAGMTGTAREVTNELWSVYKLNVVSVPTHRPSQRKEMPMRVYNNHSVKWAAVIGRIQELHQQGRPVLVGTRSVADSEHVSRLLTQHGLVHQVLNARQDQQEADIIACAGEPGRITVATNMAGRGTDICLAPDVMELDGLHVIATESNDARRIDRQLYGRCARQGDPGSYEAILSLEDEPIKQFCAPFLTAIFKRFCDGTKALPAWLGKLIIGQTQRTIERKQQRLRRNLLQLDVNLGEKLAFTGNKK